MFEVRAGGGHGKPPVMPYVPLNADPEPQVRIVPVDRTACARMEALRVVLLVLLISGQSGADHLKKGWPRPDP